MGLELRAGPGWRWECGSRGTPMVWTATALDDMTWGEARGRGESQRHQMFVQSVNPPTGVQERQQH